MKDIPKQINEVLAAYFETLESKLPNLLDSYYLYGSASLGAFKDGCSDIDFIAVIKRKVSETDINILKEIHRELQSEFPRVILDGLYIKKIDLDSLQKSESSCVYFNDGKYQGLRKFNKNSIDAYQLKKYGITVKGQRIEDLDFDVDWDILIQNMRENLNSYWVNWSNDCKRVPSIKYIGLFVRLDMVEWGVLGVSRLFYTFKEKEITSKVGAGEYALRTVPQRWHKIIQESMRLRKDNKQSFYKSIFERRKDALGYMEFIIDESNKLFE